MPSTEILTDSRYKKLLTDLRKILSEGRKAAEAAASQVLVETTWRLGKRVREEGLTEQAGYGESIMEDLAEDLDMDVTVLRRAVIFFEQNEKSAPRRINLTMAHHQELLALADPGERAFYMELADQKALTRDQLRQAIRRGEYGAKAGTSTRRGRALKRPAEATYVYKAEVVKIVDGDTLILRIDLGFLVLKEQRIRLAGIDCPPIDEKKGYEAFEFVRDQLARAPFVMVKTHQIDIYGRYVAHVFYSFTEKDKAKVFTEGRYLNQELLDIGLAKLV